MKPLEYYVISPDGLSLTPEPFASEEAAKKYILKWCKQFECPGYKTASGERIPAKELRSRLIVAPEAMALSIMGRATELPRLMDKATEHASMVLTRTGAMPPTMFTNGLEGPGAYIPPHPMGLAYDTVAYEHLLRRNVANGVTVALFACEVWASAYTPGKWVGSDESLKDCPDKRNFILLAGQSYLEKRVKTIPILRNESGGFAALGEPRIQRIKSLDPDYGFLSLLPPVVPRWETRKWAKDYLADQKKVKVGGIALGD